MKLLRRLLTYLDNQTSHALDRHLTLALPEQRPTLSPDPIISQYLPSRAQLELAASFQCCGCCPPLCTEVHRENCPVHQMDSAS